MHDCRLPPGAAMSTSQRLTEEELDEAIKSTQDRPCDHLCQQGRMHDCQMPEEFPPIDAKSLAIALVMVVATVAYCFLVGP